MLVEHNKTSETNTNNNYVIVNTKFNLDYKIELNVIKEEILKTLKEIEGIKIINEPKLWLNNLKSNISISISYNVNNFQNFPFLTKKIIFFIEQKIFSLINSKPLNINLIYED